MDDGLEGMQALAARASDDDTEQPPARHGLHGAKTRHVKDVMPDAFPVVAVVGMLHGTPDEFAHGCGHGDMDAGEVLGGYLGQVAGGGVDQDAVCDGLSTGVNGNDHEPVKGVAGFVDNVAGLRSRITG